MKKSKKIKVRVVAGVITVLVGGMGITKSLAAKSTNTNTVKEVKADYAEGISKETLSLNPTIVEAFENSLIAEIASESKNLKEISMEQTSTGEGEVTYADIDMDFTYAELPEAKDLEKDLGVLKDLTNNFYKKEINKNVEINVTIKTDKKFEDYDSSDKNSPRFLTYSVDKISDSKLRIVKTEFYEGFENWKHYYKIYDADADRIIDTTRDGYKAFEQKEEEYSSEAVPSYEVILRWRYDMEKESASKSLIVGDYTINGGYDNTNSYTKGVLEELASDRDMEFNYIRYYTSSSNFTRNPFAKKESILVEAKLNKVSANERTYVITEDGKEDTKEVVVKIVD